MIKFYVSLVTYMCYCIIKYRESLYYLAKDKYNNKKYLARIKKDINKIFLTPELSIFVLIIIFIFNTGISEISVIILYTVLFLYKLKTNNKDLKIDKKMKRRIAVILAIYAITNIGICIDYMIFNKTYMSFDRAPSYYTILIVMTYLSYIIVYISNIISMPFDKK